MPCLLRKVLNFGTLALGLHLLCAPGMGQDCSQLSEEYKKSVVVLFVEKIKSGTGAVVTGTGTGFIVSEDGYVLTANHVVHQSPEFEEVKIRGALGSRFAAATELEFVDASESFDLALLRLRDTSVKYKRIPRGDPSKVKNGMPLCSLGFRGQSDADLEVSDGMLRSRTGQGSFWTNSIPSNPGESGAPVFDPAQGKVVAVKKGGSATLQSVNLLVPLNLAKLLLDPHIPPESVRTDETPGTLPAGGVYRLRLFLLNEEGSTVEEADISSSISGEPMKVKGGGVYVIPAGTVPQDRWVNIVAEKKSAALTGTVTFQLASDPNPSVTITMREDRSASISGGVIDETRNPIVGAKVSVAGYPGEETITDSNGNFKLAAHRARNRMVRLYVRKDGYESSGDWQMTGDTPVEIKLNRIKP